MGALVPIRIVAFGLILWVMDPYIVQLINLGERIIQNNSFGVSAKFYFSEEDIGKIQEH